MIFLYGYLIIPISSQYTIPDPLPALPFCFEGNVEEIENVVSKRIKKILYCYFLIKKYIYTYNYTKDTYVHRWMDIVPILLATSKAFHTRTCALAAVGLASYIFILPA